MASDLAQQQLNSNLIRFRSAPGSLLANFMDGSGDGCDEAESMFERFMSSSGGELESEIGSKMEQEAEAIQQQNGFSSASQMIYQINSMPNHSSAIESSYRNSMTVGMGSPQAKNSSNCSNLIRHSSSPAGLFSHLTAENGFAVMSRMDNFRGENCSNAEATASTSRFKHQMSILSRQASSPGMLSQISEVGSESVGANSPDDRNLGNGSRNANAYIPRFPISSWDDSPLENFTGLKRVRDIDGKLISNLNPSERQNGDVGGRTSGLTHQFSLPNTSSEISAMEKFLQFQESVPCKIRAKRGCATHPRSIAERVRRTRISERMRKLQELVPNMDKQTNTADMLDLAVEYIKDLQGQVKLLSDNQASCTCLSKRKPYPNAAV